MSSSRTLAFFGATGGCAGYCLSTALSAGYTCRALARTPEKLLQSMRDKGVAQAALDRHLTVIKGNAKDVGDVKRAVTAEDGEVVDTIVFGIGGKPKLAFTRSLFTIDDPTVCQTAMATLVTALSELQPARKPLLLVVSTTGIGTKRDVPWLFYPLYHVFLAVPHKDKVVMESLVKNAVNDHPTKPDNKNRGGAIGGFVIVRASLLVDGERLGLQTIREGKESDKPAIGYTIRRSDVGNWLFERCIRDGVQKGLMGEAVTITY